MTRRTDPVKTSPFRRVVADMARAWNMPSRTVLGICIAPFLVAFFGAGTALGGKDMYKWFTSEDGVAETMQVVFYALALVSCVLVIARLWRSRRHVTATLYLLVAVGLIFMLGEELSWGQRIWGWDTPESVRAINKQEETNLHNIYGVGSILKWLQLLVGAYGTLLPLLVRSRGLQRYRGFVDRVVPHYSLITYFVMLFVWRVYRNLFDPPREFYFVVSEYNEVLELVLAMGFFLFMVFQLRSLRSEAEVIQLGLPENRLRTASDSDETQRLAS
jgi:hypothetical protein